MSRTNGEKARAALAKRARTAQRVKDRTRLAELKANAPAQNTAQNKDVTASNAKS